MLANLSLVTSGGAAGSVPRYPSVPCAGRLFGTGFPVGRVAVNVPGSFLIGFLVVWLTGARPWVPPLLVVGFLGGFTIFSAFSLEAFRFWEAGQPALAAVYVAGTAGFGLVALVAGMAFGRMMT